MSAPIHGGCPHGVGNHSFPSGSCVVRRDCHRRTSQRLGRQCVARRTEAVGQVCHRELEVWVSPRQDGAKAVLIEGPFSAVCASRPCDRLVQAAQVEPHAPPHRPAQGVVPFTVHGDGQSRATASDFRQRTPSTSPPAAKPAQNLAMSRAVETPNTGVGSLCTPGRLNRTASKFSGWVA